MDENNNRNLILATVLSFLVIMVWFVLFPPPEPAPAPEEAAPALATGGAAPPLATPAPAAEGITPAVPDAPRLAIDTPKLEGSISLLGGRIDDLSLKTYRETLAPDSPVVRLLSPVGEVLPFYALFGWSAAGTLDPAAVPGPKTEWRLASGGTLAPGQPVTLAWDNGKGLAFTREIAVDADYMFTVTDAVANTGAGDVALAPYAQIARHGLPPGATSIYVVHEGAIQRADGELTETRYKDIAKLPLVEREGYPAELTEARTDGWIGFTDHYWMTILIPEAGQPFTGVTKFVPGPDIYQTEVRRPLLTLGDGQGASVSTRFFAGAKEFETIERYQNQPGFLAGLTGTKADPALAPIPGFVDSIDWGWFFFLTKPIFAILHWIHGAIGNMGLAIIALTFALKVIVLPLAYKSYVSMARMKELQPEMEALKERAGDDKARLQKEMMQLYRDRKVNPAAGCLPVLIQIPIFFSLYKVIYVTIELRQAAFFGWIRDLSAPDPSSLFNLFGALPWDAPMAGTLLHTVFVGALPILLGLTMWLQQKLNPAPADPVQGQIFAWMPWVFMFMLGSFASGLVVYWITNNLITFSQQYMIMRSHGHRPDIFGNIRKGIRRRGAPAGSGSEKEPGKPAKGTANRK